MSVRSSQRASFSRLYWMLVDSLPQPQISYAKVCSVLDRGLQKTARRERHVIDFLDPDKGLQFPPR